MALRALLLIAALLVVSTGSAVAQDSRWFRAESDNFIVYSRHSERRVREAVVLLENFDNTLGLLTGTHTREQDGAKLTVYLLRNDSELRSLGPISRHALGFYHAGDEQIAAFVIYDDEGWLDGKTVLFHEYAHHFMLHYFPHAYPRWYIEGWAEYVSTMEFDNGRVTVGRPSGARSYSIINYGMLPVELLLAPERAAEHGRRMDSEFQEEFYATSWFATMFINNRPELKPGLTRYIEALGEGGDPLESFEPAFGLSPDAFEQELRRFRRGRVTAITITLPDYSGPLEISRLPASADDLLLPLARLRMGVSEEDAGSVARDVLARAARRPGDPLAELAAARALLLSEDYAVARARLTALLAADETNTEARYLRAAATLREATDGDSVEFSDIQEARRELARGFRHDPNHFPTLFLYASSFSNGSSRMGDDQLNVMARALELAPQSDVIRVTLARELMLAEEYDTAALVLRPLIYAPHGGAIAEEARVLFDAARNHQPPPARDIEVEGAEEPSVEPPQRP